MWSSGRSALWAESRQARPTRRRATAGDHGHTLMCRPAGALARATLSWPVLLRGTVFPRVLLAR